MAVLSVCLKPIFPIEALLIRNNRFHAHQNRQSRVRLVDSAELPLQAHQGLRLRHGGSAGQGQLLNRIPGSPRTHKYFPFDSDELYAVKVVKLASLTFKKLEELLEQEIAIIRSLDHPNVIRCAEVLKSTNHCYFITELCEGGNL